MAASLWSKKMKKIFLAVIGLFLSFVAFSQDNDAWRQHHDAVEANAYQAMVENNPEKFALGWGDVNKIEARTNDLPLVLSYKAVWFARTGNWQKAQEYLDKVNRMEEKLDMLDHQIPGSSHDIFLEALHRITNGKAGLKPLTSYLDYRFTDLDQNKYIAKVVTQEALGMAGPAPQVGKINPVNGQELTPEQEAEAKALAKEFREMRKDPRATNWGKLWFSLAMCFGAIGLYIYHGKRLEKLQIA
jgi:hypothetical protein